MEELVVGNVAFRGSPIHGMGGFARKDIRAGARIVEYVGEKMDKKEALRRCEAGNVFVFEINDDFDIDGSVDWNPARQELVWSGLPMAVPSLFQSRDGNTEFLTLSLFPLTKTRRQPPSELFAQLKGGQDLVLYDWESSQFRLPSWRQLYQISEIGTQRHISTTNLVSQRWQVEVSSHLGDSATELRATSPTQMTLVRKSTLGLTSFELATLTRWLDSSSFPAFGLYPSPSAARARPTK